MATYSFTGVDGNAYHLSKLTHGDIVEIHKWAQYKPYFDLRSLKDKIDADDYARESQAILARCGEKTADQISKEAAELERTIAGMGYILFLSLRHRHPDITEQQAGGVIDESNADEFIALMDVMNSAAGVNSKKKKLKA